MRGIPSLSISQSKQQTQQNKHDVIVMPYSYKPLNFKKGRNINQIMEATSKREIHIIVITTPSTPSSNTLRFLITLKYITPILFLFF